MMTQKQTNNMQVCIYKTTRYCYNSVVRVYLIDKKINELCTNDLAPRRRKILNPQYINVSELWLAPLH